MRRRLSLAQRRRRDEARLGVVMIALAIAGFVALLAGAAAIDAAHGVRPYQSLEAAGL